MEVSEGRRGGSEVRRWVRRWYNWLVAVQWCAMESVNENHSARVATGEREGDTGSYGLRGGSGVWGAECGLQKLRHRPMNGPHSGCIQEQC